MPQRVNAGLGDSISLEAIDSDNQVSWFNPYDTALLAYRDNFLRCDNVLRHGLSPFLCARLGVGC